MKLIDKKIIVSFVLVLNTSLFGTFTKSGDIVTDSVSGLQWQDQSANTDSTHTWYAAIAQCESLTLGGFSDWRLPNAYEMFTIQDTSINGYPNWIAQFTHKLNSWYWTSTTYKPLSAENAYGSYLETTQRFAKSISIYYRCVRGGVTN